MRVTPSWSELLQTPASVVVLGAAAVAVATWAPGRALRFVLPGAVFVGASQVLGPMLIWWGPTGDWRWFLPLANSFDLHIVGDAGIVVAIQRAAMTWHIIYLIGVGLLLAATSLAKHASRRRTVQIASAGLTFAAGGGSLQALVSCHQASPRPVPRSDAPRSGRPDVQGAEGRSVFQMSKMICHDPSS